MFIFRSTRAASLPFPHWSDGFRSVAGNKLDCGMTYDKTEVCTSNFKVEIYTLNFICFIFYLF